MRISGAKTCLFQRRRLARQIILIGGGGRTEMVEPYLTCGQGEVQRFLLTAWDKNVLEANFEMEYTVTCQ